MDTKQNSSKKNNYLTVPLFKRENSDEEDLNLYESSLPQISFQSPEYNLSDEEIELDGDQTQFTLEDHKIESVETRTIEDQPINPEDVQQRQSS